MVQIVDADKTRLSLNILGHVKNTAKEVTFSIIHTIHLLQDLLLAVFHTDSQLRIRYITCKKGHGNLQFLTTATLSSWFRTLQTLRHEAFDNERSKDLWQHLQCEDNDRNSMVINNKTQNHPLCFKNQLSSELENTLMPSVFCFVLFSPSLLTYFRLYRN